MHPVMPAPDLVFQRGGIGGQGIGVGHFENGGHAPHDSGARA